MNAKERIHELFQKHLNDELTSIEQDELAGYLAHSQYDAELKKTIEDTFSISSPIYFQDPQVASAIFQKIIREEAELPTIQSWYDQPWIKYAAAVLVFVGFAYLWTTRQTLNQESPDLTKVKVNDIPPGGQKAMLRLADGSTINLDSAANGRLITEGNAAITKEDGTIIYNVSANFSARKSSGDGFNTMITPRGGLYQLVLSDGTKAWLNSASSITFPVRFSNNQRKVKVTGEVYFEIAKNKTAPFIVDVSNGYEVLVLGTAFNINAYSNEGQINTSLVNGSVKVQINSSEMKTSAVLKPGQQASVSRSKMFPIQIKNNIDIDEVIAWQKGMFVFDNSDLLQISRQLSRWYDVDVEIEGDVSRIKLGGGISKNVPLSETLTVLESSGAGYKWVDKKLVLYVPK